MAQNIFILLCFITRIQSSSWLQLGMQFGNINNVSNPHNYHLHANKKLNKNIIDNSFRNKNFIHTTNVFSGDQGNFDTNNFLTGNDYTNHKQTNYLNNDEIFYNYNEDSVYNNYYNYGSNNPVNTKKRHVNSYSNADVQNNYQTGLKKIVTYNNIDNGYIDYDSDGYINVNNLQANQKNPYQQLKVNFEKQQSFYQQNQIRKKQWKPRKRKYQQINNKKYKKNPRKNKIEQRLFKKQGSKNQRKSTKEQDFSKVKQKKVNKTTEEEIIEKIFSNLCNEQKEARRREEEKEEKTNEKEEKQKNQPEVLPSFPKRNVCNRQDNEVILQALKESSLDGLIECRRQFEGERWNCELMGVSEKKLDHILNLGTKEAAFIHAITSSSLVHKLTTLCSKGLLEQCSCDASQTSISSRDEAWRWGGCSDDVEYGVWLSKLLIDEQEMKILKENNDENVDLESTDRELNEESKRNNDGESSNVRDDPGGNNLKQVIIRSGSLKNGVYEKKTVKPQNRKKRNNKSRRVKNKRDIKMMEKITKSLVNVHNNQVGRKTISSMMSHSCRCHGVSGSCAVRTCWRALPTFPKVGDLLKLKYETSVEINPPPLLLLVDKNRLKKKNTINKNKDKIDKKFRRSLNAFSPNRTVLNNRRKFKKIKNRNNYFSEINNYNKRYKKTNYNNKEAYKNMKALKRYGNIDMTALKKILRESGANLTSLSTLYNKRREKRKSKDPISENELVFVSKSPNFCKQNPALGISGTRDRRCIEGDEGSSGCKYLCCGRSYRVLVERRIEACQCKFVWCCEVVCKQCEVIEEIAVCN